MNYYLREKVFWLAMVVMIILYMDIWAWDTLKPLLFGWIPYEMWYRALLTLLSGAMLWWLGAWAWPDPKQEDLERVVRREDDQAS